MNGVQVASLAIMFLGFLLTCITVGIPYWEKSDPSDTVNDNIINVSITRAHQCGDENYLVMYDLVIRQSLDPIQSGVQVPSPVHLPL